MTKRIISVLVVLAILFSFAGCGKTSVDTFESAMLLLQSGNLSGFADCLTEDSALAVKAAADLFDSSSEASEKSVLSLLSQIRFSLDKEQSTDEKMTVRLTAVDFDLLASYLENVNAIGGNGNKNSAVSELIDSGKMASMFLKTAVLSVTMVREESGEWKIPFSVAENKDLVNFIDLSVMIRFFAK